MRRSKWAKYTACYFASFFVSGLCALQFAAAQSPVLSSNSSEALILTVLGPLTPSSKAFGIAHLQGITLAVDEHNQKNKDSGPRIELNIIDDKATPAVAASALKSLRSSDTVAILGPANSAVTREVIQLLDSQFIKIPVVSSLSTATSLTEDVKNPYFLRANVSDQKRLDALLGLIFEDENLKPRRLIAFYERADAFGEGMLKDAKRWLAVNNLNFLNHDVLEVPYPRDVPKDNAAELISEAYAKNFGAKNDAILLLGIAQDAITFIDALRKKNIQSRIYFNEPDYLVFKAAADRGVPIAGVHVLSVFWPENATVNSFNSAFRRKFNEAPSFSAALSYDAARLVLRAIDVALAEGPPASKDMQAFRDRVMTNLHKDAGPSLDYVLPGDHRFVKSQYLRLDFQGLQYTSRGGLVQWNENPQEPTQLQTVGGEKPIIMPPLYTLAFVLLFGCLGSMLREFTRYPPQNLSHFVSRLVSPISLVIDLRSP